MIRGNPIRLSASGDAAPTEFRLFQKNWNATQKGSVLFDDVAAKSVMAAYREWGIDLCVDLEHASFDVEPGAADPHARDARAWFKLELRNGELWAVGCKWTEDGAARLAAKTQRYISPAFEIDPKTKRVMKVLNCALTSLPASHNAPALVAASATGGKKMDKDLVTRTLEVIQSGDASGALPMLKEWIAKLAGADASDEELSDDPTAEGDSAGAEGDGAEGVASPPPRGKKLNAKQLSICKEFGITPATFRDAQRALRGPLTRR